MKLISTVFLFFIFFTPLYLLAQNEKIDSLTLLIENASPNDDTTIISGHYDIASELINIGKYEAAKKELKVMADLSEAANYEIGKIKAKYGRANIHIFESENEEALTIFQEIENQIDTKGLTEEEKSQFMSPIYSSMGNIYDYYSDYGKALEYHTKSIQIAKKLGNDVNYAIGLGNIASVYQKTGDLDEAIEYQLKSIAIKEKENSPLSLGISYYNLSQVYDQKKDFQKAIDMLALSKEYAIKANDDIGIALCNISIGNAYVSLSDIDLDSLKNITASELKLLDSKALLEKAFQYELEAIQLLESIKEVHYIPHAYNGMGTVLGNQKKYNEAIQYYLKSYKITEGNNLAMSKTSAEGLYEVHKRAKKYKEALLWHETYLSLKDSINNEENQKEIGRRQAELSYIKTQEIAELKHQTEIEQINHENEKKELIAQNKQRQQRYIIWSIALGLVLIGVFLIVVIKRWRVTKAQKETIDQQKQFIEKEKLATEDSINYARNIQKAAFPSLTEVKNVIPNNFILFNPKDIVSGDFYWASQIGNKKFVALADCTGHGVPGAFMTLISLNILNQIIADGIDTPIAILEQLHLRLQKRLNNKDGNASKHGLDLAICLVEDQKVTYAGVHIPIYHVRNGSLTEYKGQKFQLGSNGETLFQQYEILTQPGDTFYISTDGFPDQKGGPKGKKYFYPTLRKKLLSIVHLELEEQRQDLNKEFVNWKGQQEQLDDVSILGFKI
ncbi:MAG: tetratricopeptide repeat protein [Flavobacteriales bacterium]|jgi:serine phosphatase RsbU (regulator of sigma subunit)|nr:tetratricopeptide repeat protein [Flavobacteriales bacterium]